MKLSDKVRPDVEVAPWVIPQIINLENEVEKWKRIAENTVVQKEGMELYAEIKRLKERVHHLEQCLQKGVWPR